MSIKTRADAIAQFTAPGEAFELVPGQVFGRPCVQFKNAPPTLRDLFEDSRSELPFIIYEEQRLTLSLIHI